MPHHTLHEHFEAYLEELAPKLGHADRVASFKDYGYGLMLSLPRKALSLSPPASTSLMFRHATKRFIIWSPSRRGRITHC